MLALRRSASRQAGFTLVEVAMASLILVVGFIGLIQAVTLGGGMLAQARREALATRILEHEIEKLRFKSWPEIVALPTASTAVALAAGFAAEATGLGATFTLARTLTSPDPATNLREVNFTVTWVVTSSRRNPDGTLVTFTHTRSNSAYFGKNGLNLSYQRS